MEKENIVELKNISVAFDGEQVLDGLKTVFIVIHNAVAYRGVAGVYTQNSQSPASKA